MGNKMMMEISHELDNVIIPFNYFKLTNNYEDIEELENKFALTCSSYLFDNCEITQSNGLKTLKSYLENKDLPLLPITLNYHEILILFKHFLSDDHSMLNNLYKWESTMVDQYNKLEFVVIFSDFRCVSAKYQNYFISIFPKILIKNDKDYVFYDQLKRDGTLTVAKLRTKIKKNISYEISCIDWKQYDLLHGDEEVYMNNHSRYEDEELYTDEKTGAVQCYVKNFERVQSDLDQNYDRGSKRKTRDENSSKRKKGRFESSSPQEEEELLIRTSIDEFQSQSHEDNKQL